MRADPVAGTAGPRPGAGFTLLEVLVALIIFGIAFAALASLFQTSLRQTATAEDLRRATELAETQLERFGRDLPLAPGRIDGSTPDGLRWQAEVSLARPAVAEAGAALYRIRVDAGPQSGPPALITLTTLRIGIP
jgi:prepilin-type N-terminal cleavage/methylation domain-containing protein